VLPIIHRTRRTTNFYEKRGDGYANVNYKPIFLQNF